MFHEPNKAHRKILLNAGCMIKFNSTSQRAAGEDANINLRRGKYAKKYGNSDMIPLIQDEHRI